jgi:hypothetical protein
VYAKNKKGRGNQDTIKKKMIKIRLNGEITGKLKKQKWPNNMNVKLSRVK